MGDDRVDRDSRSSGLDRPSDRLDDRGNDQRDDRGNNRRDDRGNNRRDDHGNDRRDDRGNEQWDDRGDDRRDDQQDRWDDRQDNVDDRMEYREDAYDDHHDSDWHEDRLKFAIGTSLSRANFRALTCASRTVEVDGDTYYNCGQAWYIRYYYGGEVQ